MATTRTRICIAAGLALAGTAVAGPHGQGDSKKTTTTRVVTPAPRASEAKNFEFITHEGSDKYEIIVKGDEVIARVNGLRVAGDRLKQGENSIVIYDDSGDVLKRIAVGPRVRDRIADIKIAPTVRFDDDRDNAQWAAGGEHPPVMLGVLLESPGEALRSQLGVGEHTILIEKVMKGLPAQKAGLKQWDIVVAINGHEVDGARMLGKILMESEPGDELDLVIIRGGKKIERTLELEAYDAESLGSPNIEVTVRPDEPGRFPGGLRGWNFQGQESAQREIEKAMEKLKGMEFGNEAAARQLEQLQRNLEASKDQWAQRGRAILDNKGRLLTLDDDERDEMAEELEDRLEDFEDQFEDRLEALEDRLEERWDRMEQVFDRMFSKVERMLEESRDDRD
jgi:hypothetical protein